MAKKEYSNLSPLKALINPKETLLDINTHTLLFISAILIGVLAVFSGLQAIAAGNSFIGNFVSVLLGSPVVLFLTYAPIHLFISALKDNHKRSFFQSFLLFISYVLPLMIIGHILMLIPVQFIIELGALLLVVFTFVVILRNLSTYFKTTYSKVATSIIITLIVYYLLSLTIYVVNLLRELQGW